MIHQNRLNDFLKNHNLPSVPNVFLLDLTVWRKDSDVSIILCSSPKLFVCLSYFESIHLSFFLFISLSHNVYDTLVSIYLFLFSLSFSFSSHYLSLSSIVFLTFPPLSFSLSLSFFLSLSLSLFLSLSLSDRPPR